jgi:AcrR family transcriptional regulator
MVSLPERTPGAGVLTTPAATAILAVAVSILETAGYDAVQVRAVAKGAHVSLRTIYEHFSSRDELVAAAVARWMQDNVYRPPPHVPADAPLSERVLAILEHLMAPWKRSPKVLEAFVRARIGPHRAVLTEQSQQQSEELMRAQFGDADPERITDVIMVLDNVLYALLARTVARELTFDTLTGMTRQAVVHLTTAFE